MQNRYVGDIGDFAKYGLLRYLSGLSGAFDVSLSLGVVWYLVPDETRTNDGRHVDYLSRESDLRSCDEKLYATMKKIVSGGTRTVSSVESSGILGKPPSTKFFGDELKPRWRDAWYANAAARMRGSQLVFLDPDNGIATPRIYAERHRMHARKHATIQEIRGFHDDGASVITIHHFGRQGSHEAQMASLRSQMGLPGVRLLKWNPVATRAFIVIPSAQNGAELVGRIEKMRQSAWSRHFSFH